MSTLTAIVILVPSILSCITSLIYAYLAYKRMKEPPKDEIWETVVRLMCQSGQNVDDSDRFAELYKELQYFKEHESSYIVGKSDIFNEVRNQNTQQEQPQSEPN